MEQYNIPEVLSNRDQYHFELGQLPRMSDEQQQELAVRARKGDEQARMQLIESIMHMVERVALRFTYVYLQPNDYLDIVQIGNLALVEHLDRALEKEAPAAYLFSCARYKMRNYCRYHSKFIQLPESARYLQMEYDPFAALLEELEPEEQSAFDATYGELHKALQTLTKKQHEVVVRHYGMDGYGPESLGEIERRMKMGKQVAHSRHNHAVAQLRRYFKKHA